jgi:Undecaprenyl-phosphate galactose phosphotransferase WbaP
MERTIIAGAAREEKNPKVKISVRRFARTWMGILLLLADLSGLAIAINLTAALNFDFVNFMLLTDNHALDFWLLFTLFSLVNFSFRLYPGVGLSPVSEMQLLAKATTFSFVVIILTNITWAKTPVFLHFGLVVDWTMSLIMIQLARWLIRIAATRSGMWGEPVAVLGWGKESCWAVDYFLKRSRLGINPAIFIDLDSCNSKDCSTRCFHISHSPTQRRDFFSQNGIHTAVVVKGEHQELGLQKAIEDKRLEFSRYILIPNIRGVSSFGVLLHDLEGLFGMEVRNNLANPSYRLIKRFLDILLVLLGSVFILPVSLFIVLCILFDSRGNPFYSHGRVGKNRRLINVWKFRSMVPNAERILESHLKQNPKALLEWQQTQKLKNDPRVTRIGNFIRRISLDELPQLWNVLKGEMSLVGPRPVTPDELERYGEGKNQYLSVQPGLTGLWQVSGRNNTSYTERVQFDEYYARNWSIWLDIYILFRTIWVVLNRQGAY